ncbi:MULTISPECIES: cupin domain-containing protein [Amycolatopsis]|uniref:Cupin domain protein n=2 Tax=Amycolatopsis TaxID=1813 RepID=A0A1I3NKW0_9PSEU|nr:cupin domain-containing protein [Amycolatopsis sacchari]SFJ09396.1 Cupin domain protein [Amycolatopsis sacchari]
MDITKATPLPVPADWVTGTTRLANVPGAPEGFTYFHVEFEPGARTAWHRHPRGQLIYVTAGEGLVQRRGGPVERITAGDTVWTEPGEWHWHGAGPATGLSHLTLQGVDEHGDSASWGEPVGDDEYPGA